MSLYSVDLVLMVSYSYIYLDIAYLIRFYSDFPMYLYRFARIGWKPKLESLFVSSASAREGAEGAGNLKS